MPTRRHLPLLLSVAALLPLAGTPAAVADARHPAFTLEILVDGRPVPQYLARGTRYVEALKGTEYAIRLRNPLGVRVAVALSVDGLNTIDARRSTAAEARKWVLGPYQTVTISGWQTSSDLARRFFFTTEERSYAQWLGRTDDMGIIGAVFYRERVPEVRPVTSAPVQSEAPPAAGRAERSRQQSPAAAAPAPADAASKAAGVAQESEYAATGIGRDVRHHVERVWLDLESTPAAAVNLRYEYRAQLVKLGVLPDAPPADRLSRRERARGFEGFCPTPPR
jgi:hypothetical protein